MGNPWMTASGDVAHPDSPRGGGGPGYFGGANPSGTGGGASDVADPYSPVGRNVVVEEEEQKAIELEAKAGQPKVVKSQDVLSADVKKGADALVGNSPIGTGECYDLADKVLKEAGAKSAPEFGTITADANYKWGVAVSTLGDVKEGDVLQMRGHSYKIVTETKTVTTPAAPGGTPGEDVDTKEDGPWSRPHHTAVVVGVNSDGSFTIVEQNLIDYTTGNKYTTIQKSTLYWKAGKTVKTLPPVQKNVTGLGMCRIDTTITTTITVSGTIWPYRPKVKE